MHANAAGQTKEDEREKVQRAHGEASFGLRRIPNRNRDDAVSSLCLAHGRWLTWW
jgi:hypothetical protein